MKTRTAAEEFVKTWMKAHAAGKNVKDVAKSVGITWAAANARAYQLRRRGIALPKLARAPRPNTYTPEVMAELNVLCGKK